MASPIEVKVSKAIPATATAVAVPVFSDRLGKVEGLTRAFLKREGFAGRGGSHLVLKDSSSTRVLVGLGESGELQPNDLRRAAAVFARSQSSQRRIGFDLEAILDEGESLIAPGLAVKAVVEGLILGGYTFDKYRQPDTQRRLTGATISAGANVRFVAEEAALGRSVAEAVCFARDLVNEPGGSLTPTEFAQRSAERAEAAGLKVEIMGPEQIAEERLGGLIAVNQGSAEPARLLKLTYEPEADSVDFGDFETVALVGKGITFDSGGLSIKPAESMIGMKNDMAGAAAVVSAMCALPEVGVDVRVVSFTPMTDNMTGGGAQRPGDIYTSRSGKTVEVLNTDAEGRLVLAEALTLAVEEGPQAIIDLATLTGACVVALGQKIAGLMGNDDQFVTAVSDAARSAGERVWHLPLPDDYRSALDSTIADIKNIGGGRYGGTLTAGLFLRDFVGNDIPWAHIDIAGPAFLADADGENPVGASGFGVRTLVELLSKWGQAATGPEGGPEGELEATQA